MNATVTGRVCEAYHLLPVDEVLDKLANVVGPAVLEVNVVCSSINIHQIVKLHCSIKTLERMKIHTATFSKKAGTDMLATMQMVLLIAAMQMILLLIALSFSYSIPQRNTKQKPPSTATHAQSDSMSSCSGIW